MVEEREGLVAEITTQRETSMNNMIEISNWIAGNSGKVPDKEIWEHKIQRAADFAEMELCDKLLVLLGAKELSDEFMETLRKSQEDKKAGRVRPYEEIAKECGLGTKKEKQTT